MTLSRKKALDKARYLRHRSEVIKRLGGKCVVCGTTKNLEVDHKDPKKKKFEVLASMRSINGESLKKEVKKCQLLCHKHHMEKTLRDRGQVSARGRHGTLSTYRYCKCRLCWEAHRDYCAKYNQKIKERKAREKRGNKK